MRQVLILAILVIAAMANEKNCSTVNPPSATGNYYMPPMSCVQNDTAIMGCMTSFNDCLNNTDSCEGANRCFAGRILCLVNTVPVSPNCSMWATSLDNAGLYLTAGGTYEDSTLERACEFGLCSAMMDAYNMSVKTADGKMCPADFQQICATPPSFEAPTRSPTQVEFAITFGGEWAAVLGTGPIDKTSAKYREVEAGVAKGLAKLLGLPEFLIIITDLRVGSLVVKFVIREDPTGQTPAVNVSAVTSRLEEVSSNPTLAGNTFTELAEASGITITVTSVAVDTPAPTPDPNAPNTTVTPEPTTVDPNATTTPSPLTGSAGLVSVAAAVVAVVAMLF